MNWQERISITEWQAQLEWLLTFRDGEHHGHGQERYDKYIINAIHYIKENAGIDNAEST